ncbi:ISL3 family transposase [Vagococcus xieshaowenii]|uniref:ISL3 family transposase n=2 Tax=Vagococcus xieshaowenii TaxID=2562451 RepID=A0ABX5TCN6_9ENTE|nr:ISL3 family transposase [Vagococcus xieshaowenii]QCA27926.1 ISL3 family transposase [Vagococcus xieshaowenii]
MTNDIKKIYGIEDPNLIISSVSEGTYRNKPAKIIQASYKPKAIVCPKCGSSPRNNTGKYIIVKNGSKKVDVLLTHENTGIVSMKLSKQRYRCYNCNTHWTSQIDLVQPSHNISRIIEAKVIELIAERISLKLIAKLCSVSISKVIQVLKSLETYLPKEENRWLPEVLMVDEFRSHTASEDSMSFICADGESGRLVEILESRKINYLIPHFSRYPDEERFRVKFLVTDMNAAYFQLVKDIFPNAELIIDHSHIVKHLNEAFNSFRVREVKRLKVSGKKREASKLKKNWRFLLKNRLDINISEYKKWPSFRSNKYPYLTEQMMIDRLLGFSEPLKLAYDYFHDLLDSFRRKEYERFFELLNTLPDELDEEFKGQVQNLIRYQEGITNALIHPYSNGKIEAKNTHIKTLKRVSYGFKSFSNMRIRIFLTEGLIEVNH